MKPFIYPSSIETARALILHLIKIMIDEPGKTFNIALSGGSTPALMFDLWANEYYSVDADESFFCRRTLCPTRELR